MNNLCVDANSDRQTVAKAVVILKRVGELWICFLLKIFGRKSELSRNILRIKLYTYFSIFLVLAIELLLAILECLTFG